MESTGEANKIHCSAQCFAVLNKLGGYHVSERGVVHLKGKGDITTYWVQEKENLAEELLLIPPIPVSESHPKLLDLYASNRTGHVSLAPLNRMSNHSLNQSEGKGPPRRLSMMKGMCKRFRLNSIVGRRYDSESSSAEAHSHILSSRRGSANVISVTHSRDKNMSILPRIPDESTRPLLEDYVERNGFLPRGRLKLPNGLRLSHSTPCSGKNTTINLHEMDETTMQGFEMAKVCLKKPFLSHSAVFHVAHDETNFDQPGVPAGGQNGTVLPNRQFIAQSVF